MVRQTRINLDTLLFRLKINVAAAFNLVSHIQYMYFHKYSAESSTLRISVITIYYTGAQLLKLIQTQKDTDYLIMVVF